MSTDERSALERRRTELEIAVEPHQPDEQDRVMLALIDMFSSFPSVRDDEAQMAARAEGLRSATVRYPAWAIEKACLSIRADGVERNGRRNRQWPPSESELVHAIRSQVDLYQDTLDRAVLMLKAEVER